MFCRFMIACALLLLGAAKVRAGVLAQFVMQFGTIDVELFEMDKPLTVANFLQYQATGQWNPSVMHRWLPDFIVQGGAYYFPPEGSFVVQQGPAVPSEYNVGPHLSNVYGTLAMALAPNNPNSGTTSWFFNVADNSANLDAQSFTVFGRMIAGSNILNKFKVPADVATNGLYLFRDNTGQRTELPYYVTNAASYYVLVDVRVLKTQIARVAGGLEISWLTIASRPNILEVSTNNPANWQPVLTNLGNGLRFAVTNSLGTEAFRDYRVRIDYSN